MWKRRAWSPDLVAGSLLLTGLLVALSVFSADAPDGSTNLLGPPGAWLGHELREALGIAVHLLLGLAGALFVRWWGLRERGETTED